MAILLFCGAIFSMYSSEIRIRDSLQGELIFSDEMGNVPEIAKIEIETPQGKLTLQKDESLWRIMEADNYYASFSKIQKLLDNITEARLGKKVPALNSEIIWKTIRLFDSKNKETSAVQIGKNINQNMYYVRRLNSAEIYFSTWKMNFSDNLYSWAKQPLLDFNAKDIQRIENKSIAVSRRDEGAAFYHEQEQKIYKQKDYLKVFGILTDLHYENVLSSQEFSPELYPYTQSMILTTFGGLMTEITIYTNKKEYWLKIRLSANRLPQETTNRYIAQNKFLYDDWWFKISAEDGIGLFNFNL